MYGIQRKQKKNTKQKLQAKHTNIKNLNKLKVSIFFTYPLEELLRRSAESETYEKTVGCSHQQQWASTWLMEKGAIMTSKNDWTFSIVILVKVKKYNIFFSCTLYPACSRGRGF